MKTRITYRRINAGQPPQRTEFHYGLSFGVAVALLVVVEIAVSGTVLAGEAQHTPTITAVLTNYSQASPRVLAGAEREVRRIFAAAGVQIVWIECPVGQSAATTQEYCHKERDTTTVTLRILTLPILNKFQTTVFGFAVHPVLASVYYEFVVLLARSDNAEFEIPIILGSVVAHEIGHLLLGSNSHCGIGIMQQQWGPRQVRQAMMGALLFTAEQSEVIRAEALRRMTPRAASHSEQHGRS